MPHDVHGPVGRVVVVGTTLVTDYLAGVAGRSALVWIPNHRVLNGVAADDIGGRAMVSAETGAETRQGHVLIGQDEIDPVAILGQVLVLDGVGNDLLNLRVAGEGFPQRVIVVVVILRRVVQRAGDELVVFVAVGGVDLLLRRTAQVLEIVVDDAFVSGSPATVVDDVNGGSALKYPSAVVVDVAGIAVAIRRRWIVLVKRP